MSDQTTTTSVGGNTAVPTTMDKGKGKAVEQNPEDMEEDDEEESEESGDETHVAEVEEEDDDDNMEEIDTDNIIADGRRTRGRDIDFAKAAEEMPADEDEDEDDDDDFQGEDDDEMKD